MISLSLKLVHLLQRNTINFTSLSHQDSSLVIE